MKITQCHKYQSVVKIYSAQLFLSSTVRTKLHTGVHIHKFDLPDVITYGYYVVWSFHHIANICIVIRDQLLFSPFFFLAILFF